MLIGQHPDVFNTTGTAGRGNQPAPNNNANIAPNQAAPRNPAPAVADEGQGGAAGQDGVNRPTPKLRGWDRPAVRELDFAKRLKNHPDSYPETQRKQDASLLSAALQAISRGELSGASESVVIETISKARKSTSSYRRLWPTKKTRKAYALEHSPKVNLPCVRSVDDEFIAYTRHKPTAASEGTDAMEEDEDDDVHTIISLDRIPNHVPDGEESSISKDLVESFINGDDRDYTALKQKIHLLDGRLVLFWIKGISHSGMTWADIDDNSIDIPSEPAPTPKRKKRKADASG
jgi:hypothetical protein